jgi:hypothetical protein
MAKPLEQRIGGPNSLDMMKQVLGAAGLVQEGADTSVTTVNIKGKEVFVSPRVITEDSGELTERRYTMHVPPRSVFMALSQEYAVKR